MAAGEGSRLRPLTERWPKPVLPIDGLPVVVTVVHELAAAGCAPIVVVTGHLREQVEALVAPLPYDLRFALQPAPLGSADAVARAEVVPPYVVTAADTRYAPGDVAGFVAAAEGTDGAIAVRIQPGRPDHTRVHVENGRVVRVDAPDAPGEWTAAPLWHVGEPVARRLLPLPDSAPHELARVFQLAIDDGAVVSAIQVGRTRDLTSPADLVRENFPYLSSR
jgi:UDP-N-acetylglucosamine diphosphorylase / glucose-1-phosphate thymidylyltransferase / UDP-N-acetylgalactosamine diphosphorylase / glucosamine-1-phosphate N-acetyltransferase / galactosamine-1-phosphate N-acetyltransferase